MKISKRINLGNNNYYITFETEYKIENDFLQLYLKNWSNNYYDGGNLSLLIDNIEKKYDRNSVQEKYCKTIQFLADCLYIYDNIPFVLEISDLYLDSKNCITSLGLITKAELDSFIKENKVKMKNNTDFKL